MPFMQIETLKAPWARVEMSLASWEEVLVPFEYLDLDLDEALKELSLSPTGGELTITVTHGWCARESAPGYLDATEWVGPYETEQQAIEAYCETHDLCPHCYEQCWESEEGDCQERTDDDDDDDDDNEESNESEEV